MLPSCFIHAGLGLALPEYKERHSSIKTNGQGSAYKEHEMEYARRGNRPANDSHFHLISRLGPQHKHALTNDGRAE